MHYCGYKGHACLQAYVRSICTCTIERARARGTWTRSLVWTLYFSGVVLAGWRTSGILTCVETSGETSDTSSKTRTVRRVASTSSFPSASPPHLSLSSVSLSLSLPLLPLSLLSPSHLPSSLPPHPLSLHTEHREEITLPDELVRRVKKINTVFEGVVSTREAALDAEGFQLLSTIGREQAESTTGELVFDPVIFAEKLVRTGLLLSYLCMRHGVLWTHICAVFVPR